MRQRLEVLPALAWGKLMPHQVEGGSTVSQSSRQDPVTVDPGHYKVDTENEHARVLRIHYGPREKSPLHWHPATVAVLLTDTSVRFHLPDGSHEDISGKAGEVLTPPAGDHAPENLSDQAFDVILVELKGTA